MKRSLQLLFLLLFQFEIQAQIITTVAGGGSGALGDGGPATSATIGPFAGLAIDKAGNIYIADGTNNRIRKVDASTGIITTIAGTGQAGYIYPMAITIGLERLTPPGSLPQLPAMAIMERRATVGWQLMHLSQVSRIFASIQRVICT
jgi:hypothetical protein